MPPNDTEENLIARGRFWFGLALAIVTVASCVQVARDPNFTALPKPTSDGPIYENLAYQLYSGRGFQVDWHDPQWRMLYEHADSNAYSVYLNAPRQLMPMTGRPPMFPALIAFLYALVGRGENAFAMVRLFSALCIAIACAVAVANAVAVMARCDQLGRRLSSWAIGIGCTGSIVLAASNRTLHSYAGDFLTEPLALLLTQLLVAVLLVVSRKERDSSDETLKSRWSSVSIVVLIALLLAAMILTRSLFVLWVPGVCLLLMLIVRSKRSWRYALAVFLLTMLCMSPWWVRNCVVLGRVMPLGTQGPITMLGGYCDEALAAGGDWQHAPEQRLRDAMRTNPEFIANDSDVERELMIVDESKRMVRVWISKHPSNLPRLIWMRVVTHWNPYTGKSLVWRLLILVGAVYLLTKRSPAAWVLVGLPVMNTVIVASMYSTGGRFLVPLYGVLFTLSAVGIGVIVELIFSVVRRWMEMRSGKDNAAAL